MIRGLQAVPIGGVIGKNTDDNLATMEATYATIAKNVVFRGDGFVSKCPGYTQVAALSAGTTRRIHDFQRNADGQQFVIVQRDGQLSYIASSGGSETVLSTGEDASRTFEFVSNFFNLYGGNGASMYRFVDNAGTLTTRKWGLAGALTAPTISTSAGTLTLTHGRQYVQCPVSYYTDSLGVQRMHIGPPSPISAHTGPQTAKVIQVGLSTYSDPQVTHKWVFATMDTPFDTSSVFFFAAEVTNATTSWGDTLVDGALDTTRLAPWDNNPAPTGDIITTFQNRVVIVDSKGGNIYVSGFEEISLGIPEESFPASLFFQIPSGSRKPTAAVVVNEGQTLLLSTEDAWYKVQGYDASTLTRHDRVISPGAVGKKAVCVTPYGIVWLGRDKRLYTWLGSSSPFTTPMATPVSSKLQKKAGVDWSGNIATYAMEDLSDANLANAEVLWFTFGKNHYVMVLGNTSDEPSGFFNWIQLWFVDYDEGQLQSVGESDFLPNDLISTAGIVEVGSTPYVFLGDAQTGSIYRWPDGFWHNGVPTQRAFAPAWSNCGTSATKRFFWLDIFTDRQNAQELLKVAVQVSTNPDNAKGEPVNCALSAIPERDASTTGCRANLQQEGTSLGVYMRPIIALPDDINQDCAVSLMKVYHKPMYEGAP